MKLRYLLLTLLFLPISAQADTYSLLLRCFDLMPPEVLVYRNFSTGKHIIVSGALEASAKRVQSKPQGLFLQFDDGFHSDKVELAVEFTSDPQEDRSAQIYISNNPNKVLQRLKCRPYN
jgi:hypothetical protein